jgi:hypothetical protein
MWRMTEYLWRMVSNSDERSVSTKRGEFLGSHSKCWFVGPLLHGISAVLFGAVECAYGRAVGGTWCVCTQDSFVCPLLLGPVKVRRGT